MVCACYLLSTEEFYVTSSNSTPCSVASTKYNSDVGAVCDLDPEWFCDIENTSLDLETKICLVKLCMHVIACCPPTTFSFWYVSQILFIYFFFFVSPTTHI